MTEDKKTIPTTTKSINQNTTLIDDDKNTFLHYSAARGIDEDFKKGIKYEELNLENFLGWTPLMMACRNKHVETVKVILDLGGDATKKNNFGVSVLLISVAGGNLDIVTMILENLLSGGISKRIMQNMFSPLSMAILFRNRNIFEYLVQQNFDLNMSTPLTGITPLMFASAMEDNFAFSILLKNKADTSIKNYLGDTANDIKNSRYQKQEPSKKLTPAEMISRSPHMAPPQCILTPRPTSYLSPGPLIYVRRSSDTISPNSTLFVTTPNMTPIAQMNTPQIFFPSNFCHNNFMAVSPVPVTNFFNGATDLLNMRIDQSTGELVLSPSVI
ncbi:uncharacterized protein LOC114328600 [Diabrotica virgifera virgifera]|uniref:Uncharacterized protein LOC114328600 n=1 Tax=Diabrotica virgifera virgifera TaxID=50390 RepID=A0A6P7FCE2_DIAVI|nr:uncharacterized protein LOC114328600 [Diabrotica virgifera virgifera]